MSKIQTLTDKEIQQIEEAASIVKKFANYILNVNNANSMLKHNLDESIKAGDVTNEQKVKINCYDAAERRYDQILEKIKEQCKTKEECKCDEEIRKRCPLYQEFVVASWMQGVAHGNDFDWNLIFRYACIGRKLDQGFSLTTSKELGIEI